jgi:hypothetical protein
VWYIGIEMFTVTVKVVLDPDSKALLDRLVTVLEGQDQSLVDSLTTSVVGLTQRLKTSQGILQAVEK